jgi:hypothetical protein
VRFETCSARVSACSAPDASCLVRCDARTVIVPPCTRPDKRAVCAIPGASCACGRAVRPNRRAVCPEQRAVCPDRRAVSPFGDASPPSRRAMSEDAPALGAVWRASGVVWPAASRDRDAHVSAAPALSAAAVRRALIFVPCSLSTVHHRLTGVHHVVPRRQARDRACRMRVRTGSACVRAYVVPVRTCIARFRGRIAPVRAGIVSVGARIVH